jgi:hypothetical protein
MTADWPARKMVGDKTAESGGYPRSRGLVANGRFTLSPEFVVDFPALSVGCSAVLENTGLIDFETTN